MPARFLLIEAGVVRRILNAAVDSEREQLYAWGCTPNFLMSSEPGDFKMVDGNNRHPDRMLVRLGAEMV